MQDSTVGRRNRNSEHGHAAAAVDGPMDVVRSGANPNPESRERLLAGEAPTLTIEERCFRSDGQQIWAGLTLSPVRAEDGTPLHFISVAENISQRRSAEAALRESEERFRKLFDGAPLPGCLVDPQDASIVDCNDAAAAMLGYVGGLLRRLTIPDIDPGRAGREVASAGPALMGRSAQFGTRHRTRSGEDRDVVIASVRRQDQRAPCRPPPARTWRGTVPGLPAAQPRHAGPGNPSTCQPRRMACHLPAGEAPRPSGISACPARPCQRSPPAPPAGRFR